MANNKKNNKKNIKDYDEWKQGGLSDDIIDIDDLDIKKDTSEEEFDPKEWEIQSIIDVTTEDPSKSEKEQDITESSAGVTFQTNISNKEIKRGQTIWMTAFISKKGSNTSMTSPSKQVVVKCRIIDYYFGLAHLNKVFGN